VPGKLHLEIGHNEQVFELQGQFTGSHHSLPMAAAFACAHQLGAPADLIKRRLSSFQPEFGRCSTHFKEDGPIFIADTRKAPYHSIYLAVDMLKEFDAPRKRIVIGQISDFAGNPKPKYRGVYRAALLVADQVVFVGNHAHRAGATEAELATGRFIAKRSVEEAAKFIAETAIPGEIILLKSSVSLHLDRIMHNFYSEVRCWEQACGIRETCTRCDLYSIPFADHFETKRERKRQRRSSKPSRLEALLIRRWWPTLHASLPSREKTPAALS
jgi:UDP-N-acetylmuramoyl-tripeptide--D-alanyl-D-alanine ligase